MDRKRDWNEFDWEKELRKDEQRVHSYLCELDHYLDLPNEEEFIMKKLQSSPELAPARPDNAELPFETFYEDSYETLGGEWRSDKSGSFYQIELLAREWTELFTLSCSSGKSFRLGMTVLCQFGKLLIRNIELLELEAEEQPTALKRAILKRLYTEINQLLTQLPQISQLLPDIKEQIASFETRIHYIREKVFDQLDHLS